MKSQFSSLKSFVAFLFAGLALALASSGVATASQVPLSPTLTLADLLAPDSFIESPNGRVQFSQFEFHFVTNQGIVPSASDIGVSIVENNGADTVELKFVFGDAQVSGVNKYLTMSIRYTAESIDPLFEFVGHTLDLVGSAAGGNAGIQVAESLTDDFNTTHGPLAVQLGPAFDGSVSLVEHVDFADPTNLVLVHADKGIHLDTDFFNTGDSGTSASLATIGQKFHLQPVPEPSSILLMLAGAIGACRLLRRKRG